MSPRPPPPPPSTDPMAARSNSYRALSGSLHRVTLIVEDGSACAEFFRRNLVLRLKTDQGPDAAVMAGRRKLWRLPGDTYWREFELDCPRIPGAIQIRIAEMPGGAPIRPAMDATLDGGLSIGFPVADLRTILERFGSAGISSTAGIVPLVMKRADGSEYTSGEIHFRGPENLYVLAVGRPPDLAPVGPIDPAIGLGGPAYSAMIVPDSEREIAFYTDVLGWEMRRNVEIESSGPQGGLGLPAGTRFRFIQLFAQGATSGYIVLLDMLRSGRRNPVAPRPPNRGLVAWGFRSRRFDEVEKRARASSIGPSVVIARPGRLGIGVRMLSMLTPAGQLIEVEEAVS